MTKKLNIDLLVEKGIITKEQLNKRYAYRESLREARVYLRD